MLQELTLVDARIPSGGNYELELAQLRNKAENLENALDDLAMRQRYTLHRFTGDSRYKNDHYEHYLTDFGIEVPSALNIAMRKVVAFALFVGAGVGVASAIKNNY